MPQTLQEIHFPHDLADFVWFGSFDIDPLDSDKSSRRQIQGSKNDSELAFAYAISELLSDGMLFRVHCSRKRNRRT